jgi:hypothetical protein
MSQVKEKIFYDSPPEKAWFLTFEVLEIKNRDHRRILNARPFLIYGPDQYVKIKNIRFDDFDIWPSVLNN